MYIDPIQACDFYKVGHKFQYPEGTEMVFSNFTPRSDARATKTGMPSDGHVVWYGLKGFVQWFLQDWFNAAFFNQPRDEVVAKYKKRMDTSLVCDYDASHIGALHDLGYLPIAIYALPEGSLVPVKVPVLVIHNTHKDFAWVTNYLESVMSSELWKATTSATTAYKYREILEAFADKTGSPKDFVLWQGHDFSFRGLSGVFDAASSGSGHLLSFLGTDTIPAMEYLENYYNGNDTFVGGSVPATEHSVMCMGGKETEIETFRRLITQVYPSGVVSIVSDTWDFWKVISEYALELKPEIMARTPNALGLNKVVFRPDSGDPVEVLCGIDVKDFTESVEEYDLEDLIHDELIDQDIDFGYSRSTHVKMYFRVGEQVYQAKAIALNHHEYVELDEIKYEPVTLTTAQKGAVEVLWEIFGGTITDKGYKLLDQHVGLIYGDSITLERAKAILERLEAKGFASANVVFGIGSFTYQHVTRDTYGFALKATYGIINGEEQMIYKDPVTDDGLKKSAKGALIVEKKDGKFVLRDNLLEADLIKLRDEGVKNEMQVVFQNGKLYSHDTLTSIRETINNNLKANPPVL